MVSRANLSNRPGMGGVWGRVFKGPQQRRPRPKISAPMGMEDTGAPDVTQSEGGGGLSGMLGRAFRQAREQQQRQAERATRPEVPTQSPVRRAGQEAPSQPQMRRPTLRERMATGIEQMGASQEEVAARQGRMGGMLKPAVEPPPPGGYQQIDLSGGRIPRGRGTRLERAKSDQRADLEVTGEHGGTRTESDVGEPTLNRARSPRSRSRRIYRR